MPPDQPQTAAPGAETVAGWTSRCDLYPGPADGPEEDRRDCRPLATAEITAGHLPGILAAIAERAGLAVAIRLARGWGGTTRSIPRCPGPDHALSRLVGHRGALIIADIGNGPKVGIPAARTVLRWWDARRLRRQGLTFDVIGRRLAITSKRAAMLCRGVEPTGGTFACDLRCLESADRP